MENNYHTYFISYVVPHDMCYFEFGNTTFRTESTGELLWLDALHMAQQQLPNAVLLSINKLD